MTKVEQAKAAADAAQKAAAKAEAQLEAETTKLREYQRALDLASSRVEASDPESTAFAKAVAEQHVAGARVKSFDTKVAAAQVAAADAKRKASAAVVAVAQTEFDETRAAIRAENIAILEKLEALRREIAPRLVTLADVAKRATECDRELARLTGRVLEPWQAGPNIFGARSLMANHAEPAFLLRTLEPVLNDYLADERV